MPTARRVLPIVLPCALALACASSKPAAEEGTGEPDPTTQPIVDDAGVTTMPDGARITADGQILPPKEGGGGGGGGGGAGAGTGGNNVNCSSAPLVLYDGEKVPLKGGQPAGISEATFGGSKAIKATITVTGYWVPPIVWQFAEIDGSPFQYLELDITGESSGCSGVVDWKISPTAGHRALDVSRYVEWSIDSSKRHAKIPLADFAGDFSALSSLTFASGAFYDVWCGANPPNADVETVYLDNVQLSGCGQSGKTSLITPQATAMTLNGKPGKTVPFLGVNHDENNAGGSGLFAPADIEDLGTHSIRIRLAPQQLAPTEIDPGVTVAAIKAANGSNLTWSSWAAAFTGASVAGKYFTWLDSLIAKNGAAQPVRIFPTLRPCWGDGGRNGCTSWITTVATAQADLDKWWKFSFALAYFMNVTKKYGVEDWEFLNEPDAEWANRGGTWPQYVAMWQTTVDAITTANTIAGIPARVVAPDPIRWDNPALMGVLGTATGKDLTAKNGSSVHDYSGAPASFWWAYSQFKAVVNAQSGVTDAPLWMTEWGTFNETYGGCGDTSVGDRWGFNIANMVYDFTLDQQLRGQHIYLMSAKPGLWGKNLGLVTGTCRTPAYFAYRQLIRSLQGDKDLLAFTANGASLRILVTQDAKDLFVQTFNESPTVHADVAIDLAAFPKAEGKQVKVTTFRFDAAGGTNQDDVVSETLTVTGGKVTIKSVPDRSLVQAQVVGAGR